MTVIVTVEVQEQIGALVETGRGPWDGGVVYGREAILECWVCVSVLVLYSENVKVMVVVPVEIKETSVTARAVVVCSTVVSMDDSTGAAMIAVEVDDGMDSLTVV